MAKTPLNVHLQQLAYLREVDRSRTLTEAARRLHVSQPALSQSLSELERRLGVSLFRRSGRLRRLTAEGRAVAEFARTTLAQAEELGRTLDAARRGEGGTLRVGMIDAASLYILPGAVRAFRSAHPQVDLRVEVAASATLLERLTRLELDLAFVVGPVDAALLDAHPIGREAMHIYAPRGAREQPRGAEWALYPTGSHTRHLIDAALLAQGIVPRVLLESGNPQVLRQMVALGLAWAVLPRAVGESESPPLRRHRRARLAERILVGARWREAPPDPRAAAFLALALQLHPRG